MGDAAAKFRITIKQGTDLKKLKKKIEEEVEPRDLKEVPIGFGLVQLELMVVFPGGKGDTDKVEKKLQEIKDVENVTSEGVTLL